MNKGFEGIKKCNNCGFIIDKSMTYAFEKENCPSCGNHTNKVKCDIKPAKCRCGSTNIFINHNDGNRSIPYCKDCWEIDQ